jgi:butyrate kinase
MALFAKWCCGGAAEEDIRPVDNKKGGTWRIFSLRELHAATNSFNYDNKLGEGGFGSVYWGELPSGDQVSICFSGAE